jgi:hypothetical protein
MHHFLVKESLLHFLKACINFAQHLIVQQSTDEGIQFLQQPSHSYRACGKGHNPGEPDVAQVQSSQGLKMQ